MPNRFAISRRTLLASAAAPLLASPVQELFDGRSLRGWTTHGGGIWTVEDGVIVGRFDRANPGAGYLMSVGEYQDFVFELEFWVDKGGNSGVFIREPRQEWTSRGKQRPAHGDPAGYEVQIHYADPTQPTGMIYGIQMPEKVVGGEERWVPMSIECNGAVTTVRVEGQVVNVYRETRIQKGVIALQIHGGKPHDHVVKFRALSVSIGE
jgi:hypothetical protein